MQAASSGHLEVVKYLVQEAGADKDKKSKVRLVLYLIFYIVLYRVVESISEGWNFVQHRNLDWGLGLVSGEILTILSAASPLTASYLLC
jgi:uncharacterized membrane protein HdeD (DUF308 family)